MSGNLGSQPARQLLILDGDDTLWSTQEIFDNAIDAVASLLTKAGIDATEWHEVLTSIDVANVEAMGFSPDRFRLSCLAVYTELARRQSVPMQSGLVDQIEQITRAVYETTAQVLPGVQTTLDELSSLAIVVLLTKGDLGVQQNRIAQSGMAPQLDRIFIVESKTPEVVRDVVDSMGFEPVNSWMIGNSFQSDIAPALECGCNAVWIETHVWRYEKQLSAYDHGSLHRVDQFTDLLGIGPLTQALGLK